MDPKTRKWFVILGVVIAACVAVALVGSLGGCNQGASPKKITSNTATATPSATPTPTLEEVGIDEADFPKFVKVDDPTKATWRMVKLNVYSLLAAGWRAMSIAILNENADHFANMTEAMLALQWEVDHEVIDSNGRSSALTSHDHPVPIWNTGPVKGDPNMYKRGPSTLPAGMYYLQWSKDNPYYHGEILEGDGVKANCLNIITHRDLTSIAKEWEKHKDLVKVPQVKGPNPDQGGTLSVYPASSGATGGHHRDDQETTAKEQAKSWPGNEVSTAAGTDSGATTNHTNSSSTDGNGVKTVIPVGGPSQTEASNPVVETSRIDPNAVRN